MIAFGDLLPSTRTLMDAEKIEELYVRNVYEKLSSYDGLNDCQNGGNSRQNKPWLKVCEFLSAVSTGGLVVDAGCGPLRHPVNGIFRIGFDTCTEALLHSTWNPHQDVIIADGLHLPFRRNWADAALCVSVIHHLPLPERRQRFLENLANTLTVHSKMLVYVWAAEQPFAKFPAQDVLVPWNLHEIPKNGLPPLIPFHKDSTKEQRIICNSIPVQVLDKESGWITQLVAILQRRLCKIERRIPSAIPQFLRDKKVEGLTKIVSGINRWNPQLGNRLRLSNFNVAELYATEVAVTIIEEALAIVLSTLQEIVYYRYYHVFRHGELEEMAMRIPSLELVSAAYDSANWCAVLEKSND